MTCRITEAANLLAAEADQLEHQLNLRYSKAVQDGQVTSLFTLSARVALLRHLARQVRDA